VHALTFLSPLSLSQADGVAPGKGVSDAKLGGPAVRSGCHPGSAAGPHPVYVLTWMLYRLVYRQRCRSSKRKVHGATARGGGGGWSFCKGRWRWSACCRRPRRPREVPVQQPCHRPMDTCAPSSGLGQSQYHIVSISINFYRHFL
jgi:hypothetical protein